jgi:hypothetical protein
MSWVGSLTVAYSFENRCKQVRAEFAKSPEARNRVTKFTPVLLEANSVSHAGVTIELGSRTGDFRQLIGTYAFAVDRVNFRDLSNGSRVLSFEAFNFGNANGVIEVRNAQGDLVEVRGISGIQNPTSVFGFPVESVKRLWGFATEGYGFNDPRNSLGSSQKTEITNIIVPAGGTLKFTKTSDSALAYNLARFGLDILCELGLPKLTKNSSLGTKLVSTLFAKILKDQVLETLVQNRSFFTTFENTVKAFVTTEWLPKEQLEKLTEISVTTLAEFATEYKSLLPNTILSKIKDLALGKISPWIEVAENFAKGSNSFLQWYDFYLAKRTEPKTQPIIFSSRR